MGDVASNVKTMGGITLRTAQVSVGMKAGPWQTADLVAGPCPLKLHAPGHVHLSVGWHHVANVAAKALEERERRRL
eukprot:6198860-Pleurochrysis_carterae.AAC.1